jgi:hypothetical protein
MKHAPRRTLSGRNIFAVLAGAAQFGLASPDVAAAEPMTVTIERPLRDPWVPPELRKAQAAAPTEGRALRAQVERKLKEAFDAADAGHTGSLTRQQANAAGLGFVAGHFEQIDRQRTGRVRFDDVKRYLIEQGAQLD